MRAQNISHRILAGFLFLLVITSPAQAQEALMEFQYARDMDLQQGLEQLLHEQKLWHATQKKKLAVFIADITNPDKIRIAEINGSQMMYAASLPKIAILVAAFVKIERGQLELTPVLWEDMNRMIRNSNNAAATRVLERVGKEDLLSILQEPKYRFYDRENGGGLWVGKAYSKSAAYHRDPLSHLSHGATAVQAARVYYMLSSGKLLGPELSRKMLEVLAKPGINHKLVRGIKSKYPDVVMFRKSGSWRDFHADSAMIEVDDQRFIITVLAEDPDGNKWLADLAAPLLDLLNQQAER